MIAKDVYGNEVELHGDSPLKFRLRRPKPFGAIRPNPPRWDRRAA